MKTTQEKIAVMQAYADGKEIELMNRNTGEWLSCCCGPDWNWQLFDYRVKPEPPKPTYVPYESAEEFLKAQREHGPYIKVDADNADDHHYQMPEVYSHSIYIDDGNGDSECVPYSMLISNGYSWQDGTPVGKLKEE